MMTYPQVIKYLESFINYEKIPDYPYKESLKLERIKEFLESIGNPQDYLRYVHVAGSKGKGSTCAFISYILRQSGYRTGFYSSPHLSSFRERIRILEPKNKDYSGAKNVFEGAIEEKEIADLVERLKPQIERFNKSSKFGALSFFEVYTSLAFIYFKEKKVDLAVLETGLGGRLDATNAINPLACAITPISYEHTQKLGNSLKEISAEKAGIIKKTEPALIVISALQEKEAADVIRERCKEAQAELYEFPKDIFYQKKNNTFCVKGIKRTYENLKINLVGQHQLLNATVAVAVCESLSKKGLAIDSESISKGLSDTLWPGRCEVVSRGPLVVLDGAQNSSSAKALKEAVRDNFNYQKLILVIGLSQDKDIKGVCAELRGIADKIILTESKNPRASKAKVLAQNFIAKEVYATSNVEEAKRTAEHLAGKDDLILVTGSLFVVGEYRDAE